MLLEIRMAFRGTLRNWRHSLATLAAVALGLIAVSLVQGYIVDVQKQFTDILTRRSMFGHIIIEPVKGDAKASEENEWANLITSNQSQVVMNALQKLDADIEGVVRFMPIQGIAQGAGNSLPFYGFAYDVDEGRKVRGSRWAWNSLYGEPLTNSETPKIMVGRGLAELMGCDLSKPGSELEKDGRYKAVATKLDCFDQPIELSGLTEKGKMSAVSAEMQGIVEVTFREAEDTWLVMPLAMARQFYDSSKLSMISILLKNPLDRDRIMASLQDTFNGSSLPLIATKWEDHEVAESYRVNTVVVFLFRNFVMMIVIVVSALSLSNTINRNIIRRTREIGTLRAIGFKQSFILKLFVWEGFFLGLFGSVVGIIIAIGIASLVNSSSLSYVTGSMSQPVPLRLAIVPSFYLALGLSLAILSSLLGGLIAAIRARRSIAESLIHS